MLTGYRQGRRYRQEVGGPFDVRFHLLQYVPGCTDRRAAGHRVRAETPQGTFADALIGVS